MCLAIPGKIVALLDTPGVKMAKVDFGGVAREASLEYLPEAGVGDYVLVHAASPSAGWTSKRPCAPAKRCAKWIDSPNSRAA